jgi:CheY-like chemotaxis protein
MILILSTDAIAAALLGALIETLGYTVRFARSPESGGQALKRVRPGALLIDCHDPEACNDEVLGHAMMRNISVVIFGTRSALDRVRALALEHRIDMLLMPPSPEEVEETLKKAIAG